MPGALVFFEFHTLFQSRMKNESEQASKRASGRGSNVNTHVSRIDSPASCWALIPWRAFFLAGEESAALRWHEMMKITATSIQDDALRRPNCAIIACCPNDPRLLELSLPHLRSRSCYYAALLPQSGYYQEFHVPKPNANRGRCGSGLVSEDGQALRCVVLIVSYYQTPLCTIITIMGCLVLFEYLIVTGSSTTATTLLDQSFNVYHGPARYNEIPQYCTIPCTICARSGNDAFNFSSGCSTTFCTTRILHQ